MLAVFTQMTWVRCTCGLIYKQREIPTESRSMYDDIYFGNSGIVRRPYDTHIRRRVRKSREQILNVLNHVEPGPLLDVGCSLGYTLKAARELELPASGVDVSEHAVRVCEEQGFAAKHGTMDRLPFDNNSFQIVVMKHVFEHTLAPRVALEEVRRVLRNGGGLFIAVPHAGYFKAVRAPATYRFYQPEYGGREHFIYYTPATLQRLLTSELFQPIRLHPHLVLHGADAFSRALQYVLAPARALGQALLSALALRREFWVVATKRAT